MTDILLVDDDKDLLGLIKSLLAQEGMAVQSAESGEEALCELREKTFELMITDFNLPGLDGLALAQKALGIAPFMPVIMITGSIAPGIPRLAEEAGISKLLFKPFHPNEMLAAIREVVGEERQLGS